MSVEVYKIRLIICTAVILNLISIIELEALSIQNVILQQEIDCKTEQHLSEVTKLNESLQQTEKEKTDLNLHNEKVLNLNNILN